MVDEAAGAGLGDGLEDVYGELSLEQRAAIAELFLDRLQGSGELSMAQIVPTGARSVTVAQVAALHRYAQSRDRESFEMVMRHPVAVIALGAFAGDEPGRLASG